MNASVFLLMAALAADTTAEAPAPAPARVNVAPASVIVHHQPAIPIVALRLSILVDDPPGYAGAGHLIQHLHFNRLRQEVGRVGGQLQIQRTSDALVYTVIGPAVELDYLSGVLHSALRAPSPTPGEMVVAMRELEEERLAEWETAGAHVRAALRSRLFPEELSPAGTESSAERFEQSLIPALWGEIYQPERVSLVAVGDVELARVTQVFSDLPERPRQRLRRIYADTVPTPRLANAESTRGWLGLGFSGADLDPVATTVAARMLADVIRELIPTASVEVEHWWTHRGQAVAAVLAVPEANLPAARRALGTAVSALQQGLSDERVRATAVAARREMLHFSRTPEHMAEVVGRFADRDGSPNSSQRFFEGLGTVLLEDVEEVVAHLAERTPVRVDIPPQALRR